MAAADADQVVYEPLPRHPDEPAAPADKPEPVYGKVVKKPRAPVAPASAPKAGGEDEDDEDETYARVDGDDPSAAPPAIPNRSYDESMLPASLLSQAAIDATMCVHGSPFPAAHPPFALGLVTRN